MHCIEYDIASRLGHIFQIEKLGSSIHLFRDNVDSTSIFIVDGQIDLFFKKLVHVWFVFTLSIDEYVRKGASSGK